MESATVLRALVVNSPGYLLALLAFLTLRYTRPRSPYGKILLLQGLGLTIWVVCATLWTVQRSEFEAVLADDPELLFPWPTYVDAIMLFGYLAFIVSDIIFLRLLSESGLTRDLREATVGALMVLTLYGFLMVGLSYATEAGTAALFVGFVYRLFDVLLLALTTVNAFFLIRMRESVIGRFQFTLALGFVLTAIGNAVSVALFLRGGVTEYTQFQAILLSALYTGSLLVLLYGYTAHFARIRRHIDRSSATVPIQRSPKLGVYENALADLIEHFQGYFGPGASAPVRHAARKLSTSPTDEIPIGPAGLPERPLTEPEWHKFLLRVRDEYAELGGAFVNAAVEKVRARYGEKLKFLDVEPGSSAPGNAVAS